MYTLDMDAPFIEAGFYTHYKHNPQKDPHDHMYEVVGIVRNTEEKNYSVLYRPLYKNDWFAPAMYQSRPLDIFINDEIVDGIPVKRFTKITDPQLISELKKVREEMYGV